MNAESLANVTALPQPEPRSGMATITGAHTGPDFSLVHHGRELRARKAVSCLLEPVVGDRVWMVREGHECFITAVLERRDEVAPNRLSLDGDVELHAAGGSLRLHGEAGVALDSPTSVSVATDALRVGARTGEFAFAELRAVAREVVATLARVTHVGQLFELFVDKVTQRSHHSVRAIEQLDHTTAGTVSIDAQDTMRLAAKDAVITGERLVKMDGEQIHLG
jgi:hypothetical protein